MILTDSQIVIKNVILHHPLSARGNGQLHVIPVSFPVIRATLSACVSQMVMSFPLSVAPPDEEGIVTVPLVGSQLSLRDLDGTGSV